MKTISKRALSVLLAVLMIISAFAVVPLTASAEAGTNIVALGAFRDAAGHYLRTVHPDVDLSQNSGENWTATADELKNGETYLDFLVPEYSEGQIVTEITKIAVHFENEVGSTKMAVSVNTATSSNEFALLHGFSADNYTEAAKDLTYETPIARPEFIRISMKDVAEGVTPEISWVEVEATLAPVSAKTLYKSHRIEWSGETTDDFANFQIFRKAVNAEEEATEITGKVTQVSVAEYGNKKYFAVLDDMTVTPEDEGNPYIDTTDYEYEIKKGDQSVGTATATENPGLDALKRNALIYYDYGVDGSVFTAETEAEKVLDAGVNGQVRGARLKALKQFSVGFSFMTTAQKDAALLSTTANNDTTDGSISINADGKIVTKLGGLDYTTTNTVNDGEVHAFVASAGKENSNYNLDGPNSGDNSTAAVTVDLSQIQDGLFVGSTAFEGTIYSVLFSEEEYTVEELNEITTVRNSILLANEIKQAESNLGSIGDENTKAIVENAIGYSKRVIDMYKAGSASQALCAVQLDDLKKAQQGNYVVRAYAGQSATSISIKETSSEEQTDVSSVSYEGSAADGAKTVVVKAGAPSLEGLDFAGWTNRLGQPIMLKDTNETVNYNGSDIKVYEAQPVGDESEDYTVPADEDTLALKVSGPVIVVASYGGLNGDMSALKPIDNEMLGRNARADSEMAPAGGTGGADGPASYAFNGADNNWWHSRWGGTAGAQADNKFNDGTNCEPDGKNGQVSDSNPIWIQTGFDGDSKVVAGFVYQPRPGDTYITRNKDYEIRVSNESDKMDDNNSKIIATGTLADTADAQTVYFPPVECKYIRFIFKSVYNHGSNATCVNASKIEVLEFTPNDSFNVDITVNGQVIYTMTIDDGRLTTDITDADLVKEGLKAKFDDLEDKLDDIKYNYTFNIADYSSAKCELAAVQTPANYTLTANVDGDEKTSSKNYNENFDQVVAPETDKSNNPFSHWVLTDSADQPIGYGRYFNYVASGNLSVSTVYNQTPDTTIGAYIPAPVYSVEGTNHIVEVPVSLFNIPDDKDQLEDFGLVIVKDTPDDSVVKAAINSKENTNNVIISSAIAKKAELTNKDRYLHRLKITRTSAAQIRAYVKVGGEVYLSKPQELKQLDAIPEEQGVLPVIPQAVSD